MTAKEPGTIKRSRQGRRNQSAEQLLREAGALLEGHFQLASGKHSPLYIEKFRLLERPSQTEALCEMIAEWARGLRPELVAGPTTGGIIISYETARLLSLRSIFAEKVEGGRAFERGFTIGDAERVLVVDDVLTTGGSVRDVLAAVRKTGGEPVGVAVLVDRSAGRIDPSTHSTDSGQASRAGFGVPLFACLSLDLPVYEARECPQCAEGVKLVVT